MASADWRSSRPLNQQLVAQYQRFNVYQLVRLFRWQSARDVHGHDREALAQRSAAQIRFRADLSASFPGHEISRMTGWRDGPTRSLPTAAKLGATVEVKTPRY